MASSPWLNCIEAAKAGGAVAYLSTDRLALEVPRREAEAIILYYDPIFPPDPFAPWRQHRYSLSTGLYYPGNKEGHIPTRSASEGPMKSSESRRGSPLDD